MLNEPGTVIAALNSAFPQRCPEGAVAPHGCEECVGIRSGLAGRTWGEVPDEFAEEFCDGLPLLSPDAYNAYLPVWLRAAVRDPRGEAAMMVGINLSENPSKVGFTVAQATALVDAVEYITQHNAWGADDPGNIEIVAAVKARWSSHAA
jgi:hypothetical protein